jgi:hypothetical protein
LFADDAAICALSEEDLQTIMTVFFEVFKEFGLELAVKKTEVMLQRTQSEDELPEPRIVVDGNVLKVVKQFKYLGSTLTDSPTLNAEINIRLQKATAAFSKLYQRVWKKRHITLQTKVQTYRTFVMPCLLYGCEVWNTSREQLNKLEGLQYRHLRSIAGKTWRDNISHVQLLKSMQIDENKNFSWTKEDKQPAKSRSLTAVETTIRLSRLRYVGHVIRMNDCRMPKILLHAEIKAGKRDPGRPNKNYRQCIKDDLKEFGLWENVKAHSLNKLALKREEWRAMIHKGAAHFQTKWELERESKSLKRKQVPTNTLN